MDNKKSTNYARVAFASEKQKKFKKALFFYKEAIQWLIKEYGENNFKSDDAKNLDVWLAKVEKLRTITNEPTTVQNNEDAIIRNEFQTIRYLLDEAITYDEQCDYNKSLEIYTKVVEKTIEFKNGKATDKLKLQSNKWAYHSLDRAEIIKGIISQNKKDPKSEFEKRPVLKKVEKMSLTPYEKRIIIKGSSIDGNKYAPFVSININEKYSSYDLFSDPDGLLKLSKKHRTYQGLTWKRASHFVCEPQLIIQISPFGIKQNLVNDCAFLSSLSACAQYERIHGKRLISNIIYPQNLKNEPIYNPCGKYMVLLKFNGVYRKIVIDDLFPVIETDEGDTILASFSVIPNELWVSIVEKAFLKVMGGYALESSMAMKDMFMLTGWIPERILFDDIDFDADKIFHLLLTRFHKGDCLLVASSKKDLDEDRCGIVSTHAYAILDIRNIQNNKIILMKNPWHEKRWKGNFSVDDDVHWTPELRKNLKFNQKFAKVYDNGIFWIDLKSLVTFFRGIDVNWNPSIFPHSASLHDTWNVTNGPISCHFNIKDNPQYNLYSAGNGKRAIWIHVNRHSNNSDSKDEFIGLVIYKNKKTCRVYEPNYPEPYKDGVRTNSPHYLVKLIEDEPEVNLTIVLTQLKKSITLNYTLSAYSSFSFQLNRTPDIFKDSPHIHASDVWIKESTGKNIEANYKMIVQESTTVLFQLTTQKELAIGIQLLSENNLNLYNTENIYRYGCCYLEANVEPGTFTVKVSIYDNTKITPSSSYNLDIYSLKSVQIS
ncbi:hypothetical protein A3Q56_04216 [Intoshia linei]|uniref:Calpain catalytic domain-containing protein n=1 Tax=Intoshia linei TaxID=1819745 RepID=A0A177B2T8_9BILA|nr:hypothetical protein A3Q56_04216 [Intoshia linei]